MAQIRRAAEKYVGFYATVYGFSSLNICEIAESSKGQG